MGANGQPIRVNDYIMQPAQSTRSGMIEIGVFSHEFGHALGLPDLYDTDYSSDGVGSWCLMASGSWSTPSSPTHLSAWCKEMMGWIVPVFPQENVLGMEFPNAEENPYAVKLWTHGQLDPYIGRYSHGQDVGREYFLIENRQHLGSELHLPNTGLLIWHIDNTRNSNSNENHRMVDVKAADGHFNGSNMGDTWPGSTNNYNFDFETIPPSTGWAGVNTEIAVLNVSESDTTMTADIEIHESNPHLSITDMLISDTNGDNVYAPGENVMLWLIVKNTGAITNNLAATLSVPGTQVDIVSDMTNFDPIDFMQTGTANIPFEFNISDTLEAQALSFDVSFTWEGAQDGDHHELTLMLGLPQIALVDDDGARIGDSNVQSFYTDAMHAAGIVYTIWDIAEDGLPDISWLEQHPSVLWFTGNHVNPLNVMSIDVLSNYMDGGGNLLLSGQDISSSDIDVTTFIRDYLAAEIMSAEVSTNYAYADPGHEFFTAQDRYSIRNSDGANNQDSPDAFHILEGGSSIFMYPFVDNASCGSSVKNQTYSSIFLGFGMEALSPFSGDATHARGDLITRMMTWLTTPTTSIDPPGMMPDRSEILAAYPNPFNPTVQFNVQLAGSQTGVLQIINLRGAMIASIQVSGSGLINWNPGSGIAGGVYFARLQVDGKFTQSLEKITYLK